MNCPNSRMLKELFERTYRVIQLQTEGITHEESLIQPPFRGNCLNWVIGHIVEERNLILSLLGEDKVWDQEKVERYKRGSEPIANEKDAVSLDVLMADLALSQSRITERLSHMEDIKLEEKAKFAARENTIGDIIAFLHWHETYHVGQLELLRQLAGKND